MRESACPAWDLGLVEGQGPPRRRGTPQMHGNSSRPKIVFSGGGSGVVSHAGSRLLAELADRAGVTGLFSAASAGLRERRSGHDPGRVLVDLAVMLADGGTTISDLAVLRNQPELFGSVPRPRPPGGSLTRSTGRCWLGCGWRGQRPGNGSGCRQRTPTGCPCRRPLAAESGLGSGYSSTPRWSPPTATRSRLRRRSRADTASTP